MFGAPFALWTHHRGSDPGLAGGSGPPEGRELLRQESPDAGWRAKGGGGRDRWRLVLNWWGDPRACVCLWFMFWALPLLLYFRRADHTEAPHLWEFSLHRQTQSWTNEPHRSDIVLVPVPVQRLQYDAMLTMFCFSIFSIPGETEEVCAVARNPGQKKIKFYKDANHVYCRAFINKWGQNANLGVRYIHFEEN